MPIKIEFPNNENCGLKIAIIGVGDIGSIAMQNYKHSIYYHNNSAIKCVYFCSDYDLEYYEKDVFESVKDSEWLFVIADIEETSDLDTALQLVNIQKQKSATPYSVLIDISQKHSYNNELATSFNTIISVDETSKAMKPVEMLISNMYAGLCTCIDVCDVRYYLGLATHMKFNELETDDFEVMKESILQMKQNLGNNCNSSVVLTHIAYPDKSDEKIFFEDVIMCLVNTMPDIHQILQYNLYTDVSSTTFSFIYGEKGEKALT